jgi:nitroreductase
MIDEQRAGAVMAAPAPDGQAALAAVAAAITGRRNVKAFLPRGVPRDLIERLIDLAVWAPNHRLTEPWRFYAFDGPALVRLGEVAAEVTGAMLGRAVGVDPVVVDRKAAEAAAAWATLPAALYVTTRTDPNPEVDLENYGATCCAVQNLMVAAQAAGLATSWSSGAVALAPALRQLAGADEDERVVGLIRIGYPDPDGAPKAGRRAPGAAVTRWLD